MGTLKTFISMSLDCKKTPSLNVKINPILDRIGYLLYDIIHEPKYRGTAAPTAPVCLHSTKLSLSGYFWFAHCQMY